MATLRCLACGATYYTAVTGPGHAFVAEFGCESCGCAEPLRPCLAAASTTVDGVTTVAREKPVAHGVGTDAICVAVVALGAADEPEWADPRRWS